MYIIDKFNAKTTFLNSCALIKGVLYIGTEVVIVSIYENKIYNFICLGMGGS